MNKKVYGVLGIKSIMSNWNADFTGYPKKLSDGSIFGSDKAIKFPIKKFWEQGGEKVLYIRSDKLIEEKKELKLVPRTLKERYEQIFNVENLDKETDMSEILRNLFTAIDVKNFGAAFPIKKKNVSITGAVQVGQGFNKYNDTDIVEQQILSPFRNPKTKKKDDSEAGNTSIGQKIVTDEAHYFYPFSINPSVYDNYVDLNVTDGYTEEDYKKFKDAALVGATYFNSNSKVGCENEFALFVEGDRDLYLSNLSEYIYFEKGINGEKDIIHINCMDLLEGLDDRIQNIEIYYNPYKVEINFPSEVLKNKTKMFNIFTREEI